MPSLNMPELNEALTFFLLTVTFLCLLSIPAIVYRLTHFATTTSDATEEALAVAEQVRVELAEAVDALQQQTVLLEAWADERAEQIAERERVPASS